MQLTKIFPNLGNSIFTTPKRMMIFAIVLRWTLVLEWREDPRGKLDDDISDSPVWALSIQRSVIVKSFSSFTYYVSSPTTHSEMQYL